MPQSTNPLKLAIQLFTVEKVQYKWQILLLTTAKRRKHRHWPIRRLFRPMSTQLHQQPTSIENCNGTIYLHTENSWFAGCSDRQQATQCIVVVASGTSDQNNLTERPHVDGSIVFAGCANVHHHLVMLCWAHPSP